MSYRITAPNRQYTGQVAGIPFVDGVAANLPHVPDYFRRHPGYRIDGGPDKTTVKRTRKEPA